LLIASLLTCPIRCSGMVGSACASSVQPSSLLCCANHCDVPPLAVSETGPVQQDQVPSAPGHGCECVNCVCNGAVLTDDDSAHDAFSAGIWAVNLLSQAASLAACDMTAGLGDRPSLTASASGRTLRL